MVAVVETTVVGEGGVSGFFGRGAAVVDAGSVAEGASLSSSSESLLSAMAVRTTSIQSLFFHVSLAVFVVLWYRARKRVLSTCSDMLL